jgi:NAD(P)-dependent dehydrogenase (short-subunit alcohol dehydrogenase family)
MPPLDYGLRDRVVLVTGAASGIGRATAELLAGMGATVVASDIDATAGNSAADALAARGARVRFVAADVAEEGSVAAVVADALDAFGRLDAAANCAGVGGGHATTHEYPVDAWDRIIAVNLRGTWLSMRAEIEAMLAAGTGGAIVNVSSTLGLRGSPFGAPYSASKHGVLGLTRTAAIEYAPTASASTRSAPARSTLR